MLYILTGEMQTGKTRWLNKLIENLKVVGIASYGVITPGIWRKPEAAGGTAGGVADGVAGETTDGTASNSTDGSVEFEKLGIEALLLPDGIRIPFAWRRDIAELRGDREKDWQSARAELGWAIPDEALSTVNSYLDVLAARIEALYQGEHKEQAKKPGLFVIDELGPLELKKQGGFTSAIQLLEQGPTRLYQHALIVVRKELLDIAANRFLGIWGEQSVVEPDEASRELIFAAFSLSSH